MLRTALFACLLFAPAARAELHLLTQDAPAAAAGDAPLAQPAEARPAAPASPAAPLAPTPAPAAEGRISLADRPAPQWWLQAGAGLGAGLISVPVTLYLAGWIGNLTNNAYVALVPWMLLTVGLPSLAVTAAVVGLGNILSPGRYPFWRVWGLTALANAAAVAIAFFAGVTVGVFGRVLLFAFADALVMTGVATPTARWLENTRPGEPPKNVLSSLEPWNTGAPARWFIPATEVSF